MSDYCTVFEIIELADDTDLNKTVLGLLIPAVSRGIERYCRRRFFSTTAALLHDYNGERPGTIRLRDDLLSYTSVTTTGGDEFDTTDFLVEPTTPPYARLILKPSRTITYLDTPQQAITVAGNWGYSATTPAEVALVAKLWTLMLYRQVDFVGLDAARIAGISLQIPKATTKLPPELADWLKPFVRHTIGAV